MNAPAAVSIRDLHVRFGETTAVEDVGLEVGAGEVFGLLGPNGAGKTTTIRVLTTLLPATAGSARVFGVDVARRPMDVRTSRSSPRPFDVPRRTRSALVAEMLETMGLGESATGSSRPTRAG